MLPSHAKIRKRGRGCAELGIPASYALPQVCVGVTLFKGPAPRPVISVCIMQGPAAGAENLLLDDQAAVVMTVEEEVVRRSQGLTAGCCRCSWSKAVLATLLALAVGAAAALGYLQLTQVRRDSFALTGGSVEVWGRWSG